ncbi:MAG: electron transport complex subunit RsxB [Gammaproteobacteria bacterium]|nr:electron transport complex subunit RsxB [Gammaproteobacteria bacterium]
MLSGIIALIVLASFFGMVLGLAAVVFKVESSPVVEQIDALLPQTQCGQCSFAGCRPYAEAIAAGEAQINLCPPGGENLVQSLADLLDVEVLPLGEDEAVVQGPIVAVIIEETCIGCTLCIQACPVDAILGAAKQMHTVIESECTGCELCIAPCPVDCIEMIPVKQTLKNWRWPEPQYNANNREAESIFTTIDHVLAENSRP